MRKQTNTVSRIDSSPRRRGGKRMAFWLFGILFLVAILFITLLTACSGPNANSSSSGPVKIGVLLPLSGADAALGADDLHGAQLAVDVLNNGLPGLTLPLTTDHGLPGL